MDASLQNEMVWLSGGTFRIARRTLPSGLVISGLVYDTETGLIEVVVPSGTA
jgi:hypothetical protein